MVGGSEPVLKTLLSRPVINACDTFGRGRVRVNSTTRVTNSHRVYD